MAFMAFFSINVNCKKLVPPMKYIPLHLFLSLAALAGNSQATVINFDQVPRTSISYGNGNPYQESGFQISNSGGNSSALLFWGNLSYNADPKGNTLSHNYSNSTMTLTRIDGGMFSFNSIDLADVFNAPRGGDVQFNFVFANKTTSQSTVTLPDLAGLHTFTFNLADLSRVSWTPLTTNGPFLQLDNIVVDNSSTSVPEPATFALFGMGLAGLGFARRRAI
ncbi:MAG: PEP-CTERM sorting domain-containing protein [Methylococcaceae bacterium]|nr:PEP-CTERM sorting domain-containing protein [Methylococcaceae bacterium]